MNTAVRDAISQRVSVRRYRPQPVGAEALAEVLKAGTESVALLPEIEVTFHFIGQAPRVARRLAFTPVTSALYGSAPHFMVATSQERPGFMENLGFRMEQMILHATGLGLGTCWMGAMFEERSIKELLGTEVGDQRVVALTPLGYPDDSSWWRLVQRLIRAGTPWRGRRRALAESIFQGQWGVPWRGEGCLKEVLELTRLAPSWANTQPWRFIVDGRRIIAAADTTPRWGNSRHGKAYWRLDTGIAMSHFFLAGRELGWEGQWKVSGLDSRALSSRYALPPHVAVIGLYEPLGI